VKKILFVILIAVYISSCEKADDYSETPVISFKSFSFEMKETDLSTIIPIGLLKMDFVDGDGDIGFYENSIPETDTTIYDVFIYEFIKRNGVFMPSDTEKYLLPYFEEAVYRKHIKGELAFEIFYEKEHGDTIKYEFEIMDRAYHLSNRESTPELIVP